MGDCGYTLEEVAFDVIPLDFFLPVFVYYLRCFSDPTSLFRGVAFRRTQTL